MGPFTKYESVMNHAINTIQNISNYSAKDSCAQRQTGGNAAREPEQVERVCGGQPGQGDSANTGQNSGS